VDKLKKYWPVVLFVAGVVVFAGLYFLVIKGRGDKGIEVEEEEAVPEIAFEKRPLVSLTPTEDGHWLALSISKLMVEAETLDYDLLYMVESGITQGVPGTFQLGGEGELTAELLLGSESSGKFRYDEGVKEGTLTLKYRNNMGKLVGKLETQWALLNNVDELSSVDGKFRMILDGDNEGYFIVMEALGLPGGDPGDVVAGPYGVFSSRSDFEGEVEIEGKALWWDGTEWVDGEIASGGGVFVGVSE